MKRLLPPERGCRGCPFLKLFKDCGRLGGPWCEVYETLLCERCFERGEKPTFCKIDTILVLEDIEEMDAVWDEKDIYWLTRLRAEGCGRCMPGWLEGDECLLHGRKAKRAAGKLRPEFCTVFEVVAIWKERGGAAASVPGSCPGGRRFESGPRFQKAK